MNVLGTKITVLELCWLQFTSELVVKTLYHILSGIMEIANMENVNLKLSTEQGSDSRK